MSWNLDQPARTPAQAFWRVLGYLTALAMWTFVISLLVRVIIFLIRTSL